LQVCLLIWHTLSVRRKRPKLPEIAANDLRQLLGALTRRLRAESASDELNASEQTVLRRLLEDGPATTAALARAEWVKPQSMGATLAGLAERGFVGRALDADDGRCRTISITGEGKRIMQEGRTARQNWLSRKIGEALDVEEQRALLASLALLRRVVDS
jgi:DNA-binding MarR family transcriptional regulator